MANTLSPEPRAPTRGRLAFRVTLLAITTVLWLLVGYLATHESSAPEVLGRWSVQYLMLLACMTSIAIAGSLIHHRFVFDLLWRFRAQVIALSVGSIAAVVFAEIAIRTIDPLGISYYDIAREYDLDKVADRDLVFRHRTNFKASYGGIEYAFNELGLRERPIGAKQPNEFRILVIGDSVTLGWGVDVESTYCRRLESALTAASSNPVRVINSGVGGYNTSQELAFLVRHGDTIAPDLILLAYVYNDIEDQQGEFAPRRQFAFAHKSPPEVLKILLGSSWIYRLVTHSSRHAGGQSDSWTIGKDHPGLRKSMTDVQTIATWAKSRDIRIALVCWQPSHSADLDQLLWSELSTFALTNHIQLAGFNEWFGDAGSVGYRLSATDSHPNVEGHARMARGLHQFLSKERLLPWERR